MSSDSEQAEPPVAECDACADNLVAGEWRVLCPECYDGAFTSYD